MEAMAGGDVLRRRPGTQHTSTQRSASMSRGLTYADLTAAEQGQYTTLVRQIQAASAGEDTGTPPRPLHAPPTHEASAGPTPAPPPAGPRQIWAWVQRVSASGPRWLAQ